MSVVVNDVQSRLNATTVAEVERPTTTEQLAECVGLARRRGLHISVSGGRHSMGGQQFGAGTLHVDCRGLDELLEFDAERGLIRMGAGAAWPAVIEAVRGQQGPVAWGIRQKQTGADDLTLAGSVSSNVHGRGLAFAPFVEDVEAFTLVHPDGRISECSRQSQPELFGLVCGGYGMFGLIADVTLRLAPRQKLIRVVDTCDVDDALHAVRRRTAEGCIYGDFQYAIDAGGDEFLRRGVFACYKPARPTDPDPDATADLPRERWLELLRLAHENPRKAFALYSGHYLQTHGRTYWSDTMQLATYLPGYAEFLSGGRGGNASAADPTNTLMITELFVPPDALPTFMTEARRVLLDTGVQDIYGTIRAVAADTETFLPWATGQRACIIFNLLVEHTADGVARARGAARGLIGVAAGLGGSFYLTYHRWATRDQLLRCHPRLPGWLAMKRRYDPDGLLTSDWYEHTRALLEDAP